MKTWLIRALLTLAFAYLCWLWFLYVMQARILFPGWSMPFDEIQPPAGTEIMTIDVGGGEQTQGWFRLGEGRDAAHPGPLVVFAHGNAEVIDEWAWLLDRYHNRGVSVLLPEYRGFGRSGGEPGQRELVSDAIEFLERVIDRPEIDQNAVIYHGRSIGTGVVCQLAKHRAPNALILESPFMSIAAMTARYLAPPQLLKHPFRNDEVVASLDAPILILHGVQDSIVPIANGRQLAKIAKHAELIEFPDAGHNNMPVEDRAYWWPVLEFLRERAGIPITVTPIKDEADQAKTRSAP
ncbi:MAG: alpha/beta fold hydrolase [Phycisphaerales bacterium]|nr:alpha/beta fold hydrolase [Phycisphaerales bacterium]